MAAATAAGRKCGRNFRPVFNESRGGGDAPAGTQDG